MAEGWAQSWKPQASQLLWCRPAWAPYGDSYEVEAEPLSLGAKGHGQRCGLG